MKFTIKEICNGLATVVFDDGSWAEVPMAADETETQFIRKASAFAPKKYDAPAWSTPEASIDGATVERTVAVSEGIANDEEPIVSGVIESRLAAYGTATSQLEFITENGLEAWQAEVAEIKLMLPKE